MLVWRRALIRSWTRRLRSVMLRGRCNGSIRRIGKLRNRLGGRGSRAHIANKTLTAGWTIQLNSTTRILDRKLKNRATVRATCLELVWHRNNYSTSKGSSSLRSFQPMVGGMGQSPCSRRASHGAANCSVTDWENIAGA